VDEAAEQVAAGRATDYAVPLAGGPQDCSHAETRRRRKATVGAVAFGCSAELCAGQCDGVAPKWPRTRVVARPENGQPWESPCGGALTRLRVWDARVARRVVRPSR